jgi:hypothetical protein
MCIKVGRRSGSVRKVVRILKPLQCSTAFIRLQQTNYVLTCGNATVLVCHSFSYYRLKPQEEQLLAAVLSRDDSALEADNPFDPMLLSLDDLDDSSTYAARVDQRNSYLNTPREQLMGCGRPKPTITSAAAPPLCSTDSTGGTAGAGIHAEGSDAAGDQAPLSAAGESVSRLSGYLSGSVYTLMRPGSERTGRRCCLAEIDAQLEALQAEREAAQAEQAGTTIVCLWCNLVHDAVRPVSRQLLLCAFL